MIDTSHLTVVTESGERTPFSEAKLRRSLHRSGASQEVIDKVINQMNHVLYDGIPTHEIYTEAFKKLEEIALPVAGRYHLKKALFELGPSGYPFEQLVSALLQKNGYKTKTGVVVKGHCVNHEIDVWAEKDNTIYLVECKFHHRQGIYCDVKIPLYIQSRYNDIITQWENNNEHQDKQVKAWLVNNTRFSTDATTYGKCMGMELLSWDFPTGDGLKELIDRSGLHPLTCLSSITKDEKQFFLDKGLVLCRDLIEAEDLIREAGLSNKRQKTMLEEAKDLCAQQSTST